MDARGEARIGRDVLEADLALMRQQAGDVRCHRMRGISAAEIDPQRAAMGRDLLDVEHLEAVARGHALDRDQREVGEVLVIDGVELVLVDQRLEMRELERDDALRRQQMRHAGDEVVEVGHLRQHVVADDEVGGLAFGDEPLGEADAEELDQRRDVLLARDLGDVGGRLDAGDGHAERQEMLQQIAVVAGDLVDAALRAEIEARLDHLAIFARMLDPGGRVGREVGVLGEDMLGLDVFLELHEEAAVADQRMQRIERLHRIGLLGGQKTLAQRMHAEIGKTRAQLLVAQPATAMGGFQRDRLGV